MWLWRMQNSGRKIRIRCGQGLGDSIYLQAVVAKLLDMGQKNLQVCSSWPDVFYHLNPSVVYDAKNNPKEWDRSGRFELIPFTRSGCHIIAHYTGRKKIKGTSQFEDVFISAGLSPETEPKMDRAVKSERMLAIKKQCGTRPMLVVQHLCQPMGRSDGFGMELIPDPSTFNYMIDILRKKTGCMIVLVGKGESITDTRCDVDLRNKLSVAELLDVMQLADMIAGHCSLIIPFAECRMIPLLVLFGSKVRAPGTHPFLHSITPEKLLLRHNRNGCIELGLWDDDEAMQSKIESWVDGLHV